MSLQLGSVCVHKGETGTGGSFDPFGSGGWKLLIFFVLSWIRSHSVSPQCGRMSHGPKREREGIVCLGKPSECVIPFFPSFLHKNPIWRVMPLIIFPPIMTGELLRGAVMIRPPISSASPDDDGAVIIIQRSSPAGSIRR